MTNKLTENWFLKVLSLAFALMLWFFVMGEQKLEVGYTVPLELKNVPEGLMVANEVPSLIDVRISGPRTLLMNLSPTDISISVELKDLPPGLTSFKRLEERLNLPSALKVTRLSPSFVDVKLERVRDKSVPVRAVFSGAPAEGFQVGLVQMSPERVVVVGAEGEIKDVKEVLTETIDLQGVRDDFTLMVALNYAGKYTSLKEQQVVEVDIAIEPLPDTGPDAKKEANPQ